MKDLRIEEPAKPKENKPPQVPNDPAILGVSHLAIITHRIASSPTAVCMHGPR